MNRHEVLAWRLPLSVALLPSRDVPHRILHVERRRLERRRRRERRRVSGDRHPRSEPIVLGDLEKEIKIQFFSKMEIFSIRICLKFENLSKNTKNLRGTSFPKILFPRPPHKFWSKMQVFTFLDFLGYRVHKMSVFVKQHSWGTSIPKFWVFGFLSSKFPKKFIMKNGDFCILGIFLAHFSVFLNSKNSKIRQSLTNMWNNSIP